jgi:hypothetical protein
MVGAKGIFLPCDRRDRMMAQRFIVVPGASYTAGQAAENHRLDNALGF